MLHALFSRLPFPKTYLGKIVVVAFLGIHLPLLALLVAALIKDIDPGAIVER